MDYDIIVVGAGPAGLSFAISLADTGLKIALIEKQSRESLEQPEFDGRDIALTHLSHRLLNELGVWPLIPADAKQKICEARVLDGTSAYSLDFDVRNDDIEALGYMVSNHEIRRGLFRRLASVADVDLICGTSVEAAATDARSARITLSDGRTLSSSLLIAADSRFSETRRMLGISAEMLDFGRVCIVCRMDQDTPHNNVALECFHYGRTLAVLPASATESSIVVTAPMSQRDALMAMSDDEFSRDITERLDGCYGSMRLTTARYDYPLVGVHSKSFVGNRCALVGDAAVGMHPVTAHGYNLGLSGVAILAGEIQKAHKTGTDIGNSVGLRAYNRKHQLATRPMYHGTNEIVKFFTDDRRPAKLARKVALRLANSVPPIKWAIRHKLTQRASIF